MYRMIAVVTHFAIVTNIWPKISIFWNMNNFASIPLAFVWVVSLTHKICRTEISCKGNGTGFWFIHYRLMTVNFGVVWTGIAYCVQPNLWKRLLPHEKHRHRQNHFNCCIYFQNQANICKGKGKKCLRQKEKNVVLLCNITLEKANGRSQKYVDRYEIYLYFYFSFAKWHQGQMVYNLSEHFSYFHLNFWPGEIVILLSHFFLIPQMIPLA